MPLKLSIPGRARIGAVAFLILGMLALGGCSDPHASAPVEPSVQTISPGVLTVGVTDTPPFSSYNNGNPTGVDITIVEALAEEHGLKLKYVPTDFASSAVALKQNSIDVATGGWYATKARVGVLGLSKPHYVDRLAVLSRTGASDFAELKKAGATVGSPTGYQWNDDLKKMFGNNFRVYKNDPAAITDIHAGRLDALVDAESIVGFHAKQDPDLTAVVAKETSDVTATTAPSYGTLPYTVDNKEFGEALDATISKLRNEGTLTKVLLEAGLSEEATKPGEELIIGY